MGSATAFRRSLLAANLGTLVENGARVQSKDYEAVISKNMHSVQYRRPLACLFDAIYREHGQEQKGWVGEQALDELMMLTAMLPSHWTDLRTEVSGQVLATDASEEGGGACISTTLTKWGFSQIKSLTGKLINTRGQDEVATVVIEAFCGIGGLLQALRPSGSGGRGQFP